MFLQPHVENELIHNLQQQGWWVGKDCLDSFLVERLADEAKALFDAQQMSAAGIGRGQHLQRNTEIRQDFTYWLRNDTNTQREFLAHMEDLRQTLNRALYLGLFELEAHYAIYPPGAFYKKHLDSFQGAANRIVSVVTYLNAKWHQNNGGELLIYASDSDDIIQTVQPEAGTLAIFLSEEIPHEVSISHRQRASIAGWFRLNNIR